MNNKDFEKSIDEYYLTRETSFKPSEGNILNFLDAMDINPNDESLPKIDMMEIVLKSEAIKESKKSKKEFILFILIAIFLFYSFSALCLIFGSNFFIIVETIISVSLPIFLIFLAFISSKREVYK